MKAQQTSTEGISRVSRSKDEARRSYNRLSAWYDLLAASERRWAEAGVARLAPAEGETILEIGYGTGWMLPPLARAVGPSGRVHGIDISDGMRAAAEKRLRLAGLAERVELRTGDACELPFGAGSMNAVFMSFTLELFDTPEIPIVLSECCRVLAAGGRICIVSLAAEQPLDFASRLYEWAHARFPRLVDCRPIAAREALEAAGFRLLSVERRSTWGLPLNICLGVK